MQYQIGEVVRIAKTGKLGTIIEADEFFDSSMPTIYYVSDGLQHLENELESVNGGMPKPKKESTSDSPDDNNDFETVTRLLAGFDSCDFDMFVDWMNAEIDRRKNAERDTLLTDLGVTLARCFDNGLFTAPELDALNDMCKIYETRLSVSLRQ